jgi:cell division protease FtsH
MVCEYGMSGELGAVTYGQEEEPIFIGKEIARHKDYSEDTAHLIDSSIKTILDETKALAESIIREHRDELEKLTEELLAKETLDDSEIRILLGMPPSQAEERRVQEAALALERKAESAKRPAEADGASGTEPTEEAKS